MNKAKLNNDLSMEGIMAEFNSYKTPKQKAKFLREMANLNLPYDVKWENLAQCYEGSKSWPVFKSNKKEKDENILKDTIEISESSGDDKPLTHEELEALI